MKHTAIIDCSACLKIFFDAQIFFFPKLRNFIHAEISFHLQNLACARREIHVRVPRANKTMKRHRAHAFSPLICRAWPLFYPWSNQPVGSYLAIMARYQHFASLYVCCGESQTQTGLFYVKRDFSNSRGHV